MHIDFGKMQLKAVAVERKDCPDELLPEIVLAGRSNCGKSSLINALAGKKNLARTSGKPGKTRLMLFFEVPGVLRVTDLPGYGYAKASRSEIEKLSKVADAYFASGRVINEVLLLMDIRVRPSEQDRQMIAYLTQRDLPFQPVFTKSDKLSRAQVQRRLTELKQDLEETGYTGEMLTVSVKNREELRRLTDHIEAIVAETRR